VAGVRVFVSHAGPDVGWAQWVAWQLQDAGHEVELDVWHWGAGDNFVLRMSTAIEACDRMVAIWSRAYFDPDRFTTDEWSAIVAARGRTVPLRIEQVTPPVLLRPLIYRDLFGIDETRARAVLAEAVGGPAGPGGPVAFPGTAPNGPAGSGGVRWPGSLPAVWNVPARAVAFTGRDQMLLELAQRLDRGGPVVVQALHGWGGVGKTALATEYAHRFANSYQLVWWIDAEQPQLIGEQLAALAIDAGWVANDTATPEAVTAVRRHCRSSGGWLLVFDNATTPTDLHEWLPQGGGHVIVTSRWPNWGQVATPMPVDVFARAESITLLQRLAPTLTPDLADQISQALGDLPLALTQAGGVLAETGISGRAYLQELDRHATQILDHGQPAGYPHTLAAAIGIAVDRVAAQDPAAVQLLHICATLAPEPVPLDLLLTAESAHLLPEPLATVAGSSFAVGQCVARLGRYGLVKPDPGGPILHRLTQAIIRDQTDPDTHTLAQQLLTTAQPQNPIDPVWWPTWARLLPHLLHLNPATTTNPQLRNMAAAAAWYLFARGDLTAAHTVADQLHHAWHATLGADHPATLSIANTLATIHRERGNYQRAYELDHDSLTRQRRLHGNDHPDTLNSAGNLANHLHLLGRVEEALALNQDTLDRMRRALGEDHPHTLNSANSLANDLRALGRVQEALALNQDTLDRKRRVLGEDHPATLGSASNLAVDLRAVGRVDEALALDQDTLTRRRRVLGEDHPDTLDSANSLANDLRALLPSVDRLS
jgi:hypothetical protein